MIAVNETVDSIIQTHIPTNNYTAIIDWKFHRPFRFMQDKLFIDKTSFFHTGKDSSYDPVFAEIVPLHARVPNIKGYRFRSNSDLLIKRNFSIPLQDKNNFDFGFIITARDEVGDSSQISYLWEHLKNVYRCWRRTLGRIKREY